ncbi:tRNA (adenosine(37)-N6)-dimethylallyltransferase MiaA [Hahella sp. CCB-MM4]|uniref:tRNA (adenosine(37)-N6)-dimethylallyltransferase MiaA n=1 Tax=Hahella sp. (strain CCB-MM4) TaxID=1926491 RepID=UPI001FEFEEAD|nr:tRNA (adenosine(37)-N6)-dimethylallyltransferase MiaA [Hahella sp. CCB-MM4]
MGPTASGKTDLAMALSDQFPCELISVDSVMVYRGMDIGSAKPDPETLQRYPHRLVDIKDPAEPYSAAEFRDDALSAMAEISAKGRIPLLVGGTMMYFKTLWQGIGDMPSADPVLRQSIIDEAHQVGWPAMHAKLQQIDPAAAQKIHPNNRQRIQRALEVCLLTGKPFSSFWGAEGDSAETDWNRGDETELPYNVLSLALAPAERPVLHERIARRFELMLEEGLIEEVQGLRGRGDLSAELPSIRAVGYRQVWEYLDGMYGYETMKEKGVVATRQLAKRQMTWLRSWPDAHWLNSTDSQLVENAADFIRHWLQ